MLKIIGALQADYSVATKEDKDVVDLLSDFQLSMSTCFNQWAQNYQCCILQNVFLCVVTKYSHTGTRTFTVKKDLPIQTSLSHALILRCKRK